MKYYECWKFVEIIKLWDIRYMIDIRDILQEELIILFYITKYKVKWFYVIFSKTKVTKWLIR